MNNMDLETQIRIERRLHRLSSLRWNFLIGIVKGVGTTIGATLVASVLIYFFYNVVDTLDKNNVIDTDKVKEFLGNE